MLTVRIRALTSAALALLATFNCQPCLADGEGILVQALGDRLVVGFDNDTPGGQSIGARAFGALLPSDGFSENPSFLSLSTAPAGSEPLQLGIDVSWDFLPMTIEQATSNLFHWDGQGEVDFQPTTSENLTLFDANFNPAAVEGTAEAIPGLSVGRTTADALSLHAHRFWRLQGNDGDPTPGVYATSLRLRAEGYLPSEPIFVALSTFGTPSSVLNNAAVPWLEQNLDSLILRGDYNFDGLVDAADYQLWRTQFGANAPQPVEIGEADGNGDGVIDAADYTVWRDQFALAAAASATFAPIPEPSSSVICFAIALLLTGDTRRSE